MTLFNTSIEMVPVHCISRSQGLKIDFLDEKIFLPVKPQGLEHSYLVYGTIYWTSIRLLKGYSNYTLVAKNGSALGSLFYIGLYMET